MQVEHTTPSIRLLLQQALGAEPQVVELPPSGQTRSRRILAAGRGSTRHARTTPATRPQVADNAIIGFA